jgi:hypothetical protein
MKNFLFTLLIFNQMKKLVFKAGLIAALAFGFATNGYCGYTEGGTFRPIPGTGGGQIGWECVFSGSCMRSGGSSTEPKVGDVVEVNIGGTWYCCLTIDDIKETSSETNSYIGTIQEGSELEQILGAE